MRFKRKPLTVEAEQFIPENLPWPAGVRVSKDRYPTLPELERYDLVVIEEPSEAHCHICPTDWVVRSEGHVWRASDRSFREDYEPEVT